MMSEEVKQQFRERDRSTRVLAKNGLFRAVVLTNKNSVLTAQLRHNLPLVPAYYLANSISAATLISMFLKGEERIIFDINSNGIIHKIYAETLHLGECRGYINYSLDNIHLPSALNTNNSSIINYLCKNNSGTEINSIDEILGEGTLQVNRILYNHTEPITGIVPINNSDILTGVVDYYLLSEQIQSTAMMEVLFDENEKIKCS